MSKSSHATTRASAGNWHMLPARLLIALIKLYRLILSPWIGNQCRFYPSCSHYAEQAITTHGALRGAWMTLRRLIRCHPWHEGGCDPVPPSNTPS